MALNQRGQAAINDALFLLIIVVGISALLYLFSSNYGFSTSEYLSNHYESDFATSAIKTILYTSVPHLANADIRTTKEVDYLVTSVKQSYSAENPTALQARYLDDATFYRLRDRIRQVMKPIDSSKDYIFYILEVDQARRILFMYSYLTDFSSAPAICAGKSVTGGLTNALLEQAKRVEYFCFADDPESISVVSRFAQGYAESRTGTYFGRLDSPTDTQAIPGEVFLSMWTSSCTTADQNLFMYGSSDTIPPATPTEHYLISKSLNNDTVKERVNSFASTTGFHPVYCIALNQYPTRAPIVTTP